MSDVESPLEITELGFDLVRPLVKGGMGEVFLVRPAGTQRPVVLKLLHEGVEPGSDIARRTVAEGRALRALRHPNVVELLDAGVSASGRPYLLMEFLEGRTLKEEVDSRGPLPAGEVVDILCQVLSGLDAAHARGLVHRDLKPPNLFYLGEQIPSEFFPGTHRRVKILDFGIAKAISEAAQAAAGSKLVRTREGYFVGSPHFMAPEQAIGSAVTGSADLYAVGAVGFYLLTGRPPFKGLSIEHVLQQHLVAPPVAPSTVTPGIPQALDEVILHALLKRPEERFRTAMQMQRALFDVASTLAPPPTTRTVRMLASVEPRMESVPSRAVADPALRDEGDTIVEPVAVRPSGADEDTALHPALGVASLPPLADVPPRRTSRPSAPERDPPKPTALQSAPPRSRPPPQPRPSRLPSVLWIAVGLLLIVVLALVAVLLQLPERMFRSDSHPGAPLAAVCSVVRSGDVGMQLMNDTLDTVPQSLAKRLTKSSFRAGTDDTEPSLMVHDAHIVVPSAEEIARYAKPRQKNEPPLPPHARFEYLREGKDLMQDFTIGETFRGVKMGPLFASGGMAYLYEGTHQSGAAVLVKVLQEKYRHPAFARVQQKLHAEGELGLHASKLEYLAKVYEVGIDGRFGPFVVMEKLIGKTLETLLLDHRPGHRLLAQETAVMLTIRALQGLHFMHMQGVVHRDVKPPNLFLVTKSDPLRVALLDFGCARSQFTESTAVNEGTIGTPGFMAPEQVTGGPVTGAIDQYAMGIVLYQLVTGQHPFYQPDRRVRGDELLQWQVSRPIPKPPAHAMSPRLADLMMPSLEKSPRNRYPSCLAFADALERWLLRPDTRADRPAALDVEVRPTAPKKAGKPREHTPAAAPIELPKPATKITTTDLATGPTLYVRNGKNVGTRFVLEERHVIGRHPKYASIVLDDDGISQKHAAIDAVIVDPVQPVFNVVDLGSLNGTLYEGVLLSDGVLKNTGPLAAPLSPGKSVVIDNVELMLLPAGRLLANGAWQSLAEAQAERARQQKRTPLMPVQAVPARAAPAPAAAPATASAALVKGGTFRMDAAPSAQPSASPSQALSPSLAVPLPQSLPQPKRVPARPVVTMESKWLAPTLLVLEAETHTRYHLDQAGVIGASADLANIVIDEKHVSGKHVRYTHITGDIGTTVSYLFEDLWSTNGIFESEPSADAARIRAKALQHMQSLWVGQEVEIKLLAPGHFTGAMEFIPCDARGMPLVQPRDEDAHRAATRRRVLFAAIGVLSLGLILAIAFLLSGGIQ